MAHELLTTFGHDPLLDLEPWVGQRQASFRFALTNGVTGEVLGDITPIRGASLIHDTARTIKRQLTIALGVQDVAAINPITDRISVFMTFPSGAEYPLGRYMFTDATRQVFTSGKLGNYAMTDEMFLVDQQITAGINGVGNNVLAVIREVIRDLPVEFVIDATALQSTEAWGIGTGRGQILESLAVSGDYFSPWFGNDTRLHFIRSFDPATRLPDFDYDDHLVVSRESIAETDDLLTAPNRFVVISNAGEDATVPIVGTVDIPPNFPHSIANRGFVIPTVNTLQVSDTAQAIAVARNLASRQTIFQRTTLTTMPDPRHDSYNVIRWQGALWLELAWSMALVDGGAMNHTLRKSYPL